MKCKHWDAGWCYHVSYQNGCVGIDKCKVSEENRYDEIKIGEKMIKKTKAKAKPTVSKLKKKLDIVFSRYIRERDCMATTGDIDYGVCVTCKQTKPIAKLQCGHFQYRTYSNTRYCERNCNAQCIGCNMFKQGEQYLHSLAIEDKYGEGTSDELVKKAKISHKWQIEELENMIKHYSTLLSPK